MFCSPRSPNKRRECTGKCRQFNGFGLVQAGSGPGGRWFKSTRPDHFQTLPFIGLRYLLLFELHVEHMLGWGLKASQRRGTACGLSPDKRSYGIPP
jgi:hypothetical protein